MSPSKSRTQFVPARPRSEIIAAVAVGAAIVLGTALLIWLMRPGTPGVPGGGGLLTRQPRVTMLVLATAAALAGVVYRVLRGRRRSARLSQRGAILVGTGVVLVLAILGGVFWPGGVVRHWPKRPKLAPTVPTSSVPISSVPISSVPVSATTAPRSTTAPASTTPTTKG